MMPECEHVNTMAVYEKNTVMCCDCGMDIVDDLRQQLQQAQIELNDAQAWLYDAEMRNQHIYSCMDNLEGKYRKAQATIAAMRGALETTRNVLYDLSPVGKVDMNVVAPIIKAIKQADKALSTTAGAELLEKIGQLERENKTMRSCDNCKEIVWKCKKIIECTDNDRKHWQLAERLVSKGE